MKLIFIIICLFTSCTHKVEKTHTEVKAVIPMKVDVLKTVPLAMDAKSIFKRLLPLSINANTPFDPRVFNNEFFISFPTMKPVGDQKTEWQYSVVRAFYSDASKVNQLAITTVNCRPVYSTQNNNLIQKRMITLSEKVFLAAFDEKLIIDWESYFKGFGPKLKRPVRIKLKEKSKVARSFRLQRGFYKCDGRSGYGFRFDIFL